MKRKTVLKLGAGFFTSLALAALNQGCGGGGSGSTDTFSGLKRTTVPAEVTLPAGVAPTLLASLTAWTSASQATPAASGTVSLDIFNNGPQFATTLDSSGNMVVAGFLGQGRTRLDAQSTAELLTYFAVGGPLQRGLRSSRIVLDGVKALPGFADVIAAVTGEITGKGYVSAEDAPVKAALNAVLSAVLASRSTKKEVTRGPEITPTKIISGLEINNDVNDQIQITNTAFRRSYMWLIRTGFKDADGNERELQDGIAAQNILMPGRYGGSTDSATGLITGQYSWQPMAMDPHPVASDISGVDNEEEIYYKLITVGPGRLPGDFADLEQEQVARWEELVYWSVWLDFYLPVFANLVLPLGGDVLDSLSEFLEKNTQAQSFVSNLRSGMPNVSSLAAQGKFPDAVRAFVTSSQTQTITETTAFLMLEWARQYGSTLFQDEQELINRLGRGVVQAGMIDLTSAISEIAPFRDIQNADQANIFKITSSKSSIRLVADNNEIGLTDTTDITAIIKNKAAGVTYSYEWTVSSGNFLLQDVDGGATDESPGGVLKTRRDEVFIGNLSNNEGTATITCRVLKGSTLVGTANTRVAFKNKVREGTATLRVESRITPYTPTTSSQGVYAIAEVPVVPNAVHYAIVVHLANGEEVIRTNWAANRPPQTGDTEIWRRKPDGVFWVTVQGTYAGAYATDLVAQNVASTVAAYEARYIGVKMKVTAYLE